MKKIIVLTIMLALVLALGISTAVADTWFPNNTHVQQWDNKNNNTGVWKDVVGNPSDLETFGANLSGNTLTIYTNWYPGRDNYAGLVGINTADLFIDIDCNKTYDYAIGLDNGANGDPNRIGKVYIINSPTDYLTSQQIMALYNHNNGYGGRYDYNNSKGLGPFDPLPVPVLSTVNPDGSLSADVTWGEGGHGATHSVAIDISDLASELSGHNWCFLWGTGTCANDTAQGNVVPLPGAVLLLGAGIVRLAAYARRRRNPMA